MDWHVHVEIAGSDLVGRRYQPPDRRDETVGKGETEQVADKSMIRAISTNMVAKAILIRLR